MDSEMGSCYDIECNDTVKEGETLKPITQQSKYLILLFVVLALIVAGCGQPKPGAVPDTTPDERPEEQPLDLSGDNPIVTIEMENGDIIKLELYPQIAPNTVNNFISLANKGFYDGTIFHRVMADFMIQGGDPDGNGTGGPGYGIKGEFLQNGFSNPLKHTKGVISMARSGHSMDSAGSQFFITVADSHHLDGGYAAFGKVIEGQQIADEISLQPTGRNNYPNEPHVMKKVTVDTLGIDYPEPEVMK